MTLTGSLGTITTDGICNATVTKDGNTINTTYSMDGESLTIIIDGKMHTLKVDTATNTYQELKFSAGLYIGGKVSSSHSYYKMKLTADFKGNGNLQVTQQLHSTMIKHLLLVHIKFCYQIIKT